MRFITALIVTLTLACSPAFACGHAKHHPLQKLFHRAHHAAQNKANPYGGHYIRTDQGFIWVYDSASQNSTCNCGCSNCTHAKGCACGCSSCKCNESHASAGERIDFYYPTKPLVPGERIDFYHPTAK